jgi:hypothetical protein
MVLQPNIGISDTGKAPTHPILKRGLYVYALRRPIDGGGLLYRLERLREPGDTLSHHVAEVFGSDEFRETNAIGYLAPVTVLTAWCDASDSAAAP